MKKFFKSFKNAGIGIGDAFKKGGNIYIHTIIAIATIMLGAYFSLTRTEWCIIIICMGMVISAEMINTAIEFFVDKENGFVYNEQTRKIKDTSAGAVLVVAIMSTIVGLIIFLPKCT